MDKIVKQSKMVLNNEFFIVGDFYKFTEIDSDNFEIRQLNRLTDESVSFYCNGGRYGMTSCYGIEYFEKEQKLNIEHYKSFKEVIDLIK